MFRGKREAFAACYVVLIRLGSVDLWLCRKAEYRLGFSFAGCVAKMSCSYGFGDANGIVHNYVT